MTMQTIPLDRLVPSPANVRKTKTGIEGLAASIAERPFITYAADGILVASHPALLARSAVGDEEHVDRGRHSRRNPGHHRDPP